MDFREFALQLATQEGRSPYRGPLLAFDPGWTTGWALFDELQLVRCGEFSAENIGEASLPIRSLVKGTWDAIPGYDELEPGEIVFEEYRIYKWKADHHIGSDLFVARVIGCIETWADHFNKPTHRQTAQIGKGFMVDEKLEAFGFKQKVMKHADDAIRHGAHFLLFGPAEDKKSTATKVG